MVREIPQISPKNLKKLAQKRFIMSGEWFAVVGIFLFITMIFILIAVFTNNTIRIIIFALLFLLWGFFFVKLRSDDLLENMKLTIQYYRRGKNGMTLVSKYNDAGISMVMKFLGITDITGPLCQFEGNIYFCLIEYTPLRQCDDTRDDYNQEIATLLRSFSNGNQIQFNMESRVTKNNTYERQILSAINDEKSSQIEKEYLFSVQKLINVETVKINPEFTIMFGLGSYKTIAEAQNQLEVIVGGLKYQLKSLGIRFRLIDTAEEITHRIYLNITKGL